MNDTGARYKRSPFCLLHWEGSDLFARNCNTRRIFRIGERYVGILHRLSEWSTVDELVPALSVDPTRLAGAVDRLVEMGLVVTERAAPPGQDGTDGTSWDLIDLALQRKTSRGGFDPSAPHPGPPPPAFKEAPAAPPIELDRSGLDDSWSLRAAIDERRSVRTYSAADLGLRDLGRFLFSTARVLGTTRDPELGVMTHRPSPSAGGRHALELYPVCNAVAGLEPGAYYYEPRGHALYLIKPSDAWQGEMTRHARASTGDVCNRDPPVVLAVTAVFQRTMWKYDNIALALILKDVGALYQTMYLAATALGLAPCALGGWMEEENARWLGLDPLVESQVGAFLLGYPDGPGGRSHRVSGTPTS